MRLAKTSMTKATYCQPCQVETYVKSETQSWFGRSALNCRLTLSSGQGALRSLIYRRTKNLRPVQLLLGHSKLKSTVRYLGIEVDDALELSEQTEI